MEKRGLKLKELYKFVIQEGMAVDPRGKDVVKWELEKEKEKYEKLNESEKAWFDFEKLKNPYVDSRILNSVGERTIETVLVGIDIETPEILLADRLREKGEKIDLIIAHHPEGRAYASFYEVMHMQVDILHKYGVPINVAEGSLEKRIKEVSHKVMPSNAMRAVDAARLLGFSFMSIHTPADNHVAFYLQKLMEEKRPDFVGEILKILEEIPEYKNAIGENNAPTILVGNKNRRAGKIFVDMTGGTEGSVEALEKLSYSGVGTIVGMHLSKEHCQMAEKFHINIVIAGHISSDTLGLNLLFDKIIKTFGNLKIIPCSGFRRFIH